MIFLILLVMLVCAFGFTISFIVTGRMEDWVIAYSFVPVVVVAIGAMLSHRKDIFSPLNILTYVLVMSSPVFALYVFYIADEERAVAAMFGLQFNELIPGITLLILGMASLLIGYGAFSALPASKKSVHLPQFSRNRLRLLAWPILIFSVLGGYFFAKDVGFFAAVEFGNISAKRVHEATTGVAPRGSALTHWRILGTTFPHAIILVFFALKWTGRIRISALDVVLLALLFASSFFIPLISGARTAIIEIFILLVMMRHYLVAKLPWSRMVLIGIAGLFAAGLLGQLRQTGDYERGAGWARYLGIFEEVVAASYFMDLSKNAIIVKRVPEEVDFIYGQSFIAVLITPIPRQIWPDKPIVRIGYFVGQEIVDLQNQTGIPPGFIAELYLNFGYAFVIIPMALLGALLNYIYRPLARDGPVRPNSALLYVVGLEIIAIALLPTDLNYAVLQSVFYGVPISAILFATRCRQSMPESARNNLQKPLPLSV